MTQILNSPEYTEYWTLEQYYNLATQGHMSWNRGCDVEWDPGQLGGNSIGRRASDALIKVNTVGNFGLQKPAGVEVRKASVLVVFWYNHKTYSGTKKINRYQKTVVSL